MRQEVRVAAPGHDLGPGPTWSLVASAARRGERRYAARFEPQGPRDSDIVPVQGP